MKKISRRFKSYVINLTTGQIFPQVWSHTSKEAEREGMFFIDEVLAADADKFAIKICVQDRPCRSRVCDIIPASGDYKSEVALFIEEGIDIDDLDFGQQVNLLDIVRRVKD